MNISAINNSGSPISSYGANQAIVSTADSKAPFSFDSTKSTPTSESDIHSAVESLNNYADSTDSSVSFQFHVDNTTGKVVIRVMDTTDLLLISQMPSEQALILAQTLGHNESDSKTGIILKAQA
jgi:flagellar protein FlaG